MQIKNWQKFQHFKNRRPPWIKLYRDLLEDEEWFKLPPASAKVLVMLWLLASEDDTKQGLLPPMSKIAFRLRMPESAVESTCSNLSHWLCQDDIKPISSRHHDGPSETETERESETDVCAREFEHWWERMPAKGGRKLYKAKALEFYRRYVKPDDRADAIKAANAYAKHCRETDRIPCDPHRFLFGVKGEVWREFIPVAPLTQAKVLNIREPVSTGPFVPPPKELSERLGRLGVKIPGVTS